MGCCRVELALAEASRRRAGEGVQRAAADVSHGIETFEINMKRLLKGACRVVHTPAARLLDASQ